MEPHENTSALPIAIASELSLALQVVDELQVDELNELVVEAPQGTAAAPEVTGSSDTSNSNSNSSLSVKRSASACSDSESQNDGNESSSTSGDRSHYPARKARRVRKSTYTVRKEESELLMKEVEALEKRAEELRERAKGRLTEKELLNAILRDTRREQQLSFAVAQSAVSGFLNTEQTNPLNTFIRLGKDWTQRRRTLLGMKEKKIRNAYDYVQSRSQFLDPLRPHHSEERFENANGDYCCARFDMIQFEGVESVRQVFDTLLFYNLNVEISVSERLGHITVREDYDNIEKSISNYRLQSTQFGVNVETHIAMFAKFYESHELSNGKPCGIVLLDSVDEDELYPYNPKERARKDVAEAVVLTPHTKRNSNGEEELVVVLARGKFLKLFSPEFEIPPPAIQGLREGMCWGPVMVTTINELLHPEFFSPIAQGKNLCARNI